MTDKEAVEKIAEHIRNLVLIRKGEDALHFIWLNEAEKIIGYLKPSGELKVLTDEIREVLNKLTASRFWDDREAWLDITTAQISQKCKAYYEGKIQEAREQTYKEVGELLENSILKTDNRVTQLWVLPEIVESLKQGKKPTRE